MDVGNKPEQHGATPVVLGFVMVYIAEYIHRIQQFSKDRLYLHKHFFNYPNVSS